MPTLLKVAVLIDRADAILGIERIEHELECPDTGLVIERDLGLLGVHELAAELPEMDVPHQEAWRIADRRRIPEPVDQPLVVLHHRLGDVFLERGPGRWRRFRIGWRAGAITSGAR